MQRRFGGDAISLECSSPTLWNAPIVLTSRRQGHIKPWLAFRLSLKQTCVFSNCFCELCLFTLPQGPPSKHKHKPTNKQQIMTHQCFHLWCFLQADAFSCQFRTSVAQTIFASARVPKGGRGRGRIIMRLLTSQANYCHTAVCSATYLNVNGGNLQMPAKMRWPQHRTPGVSHFLARCAASCVCLGRREGAQGLGAPWPQHPQHIHKTPTCTITNTMKF